MKHREIMWVELGVDIYDGDGRDEHSKYWIGYAAGDMDEGPIGDIVVLSADSFPPGTRIVISVPECPECRQESDLCDCGFDWDKWVKKEYA